MRLIKAEPRVNVLGVRIDPVEMDEAVALIARALTQHTKGYICPAGVHGIMEALRKPCLSEIYAQALLTAPDGMPTVWVGRWYGHQTMQRVAGPDLMIEIFRRKQFASCRHFLCGGKAGVAEELRMEFKRRFPEVKVVGTYTPPFRTMEAREEEELIREVEACHPDIIWVGISTPKQEQFMHRMLPRLSTTLMFGVGAAFDFHTGRISDCAEWIKLAGLQWLDRLVQDPKHLWKRYLRNNPAFLWHIGLQLTGLRRYTSANGYFRSQGSAPCSSQLTSRGDSETRP